MQNNDDRQIVLSLPLSHVGVIVQALGEMPAKFSILVIESVQNQVQAQLSPAANDD